MLEYDTTLSHCQLPYLTQKVKWNSEQIRDFSRKLGFIDKDYDKDSEYDMIKRFLYFNQVRRVLVE